MTKCTDHDACENTDRELWRETPGDFYSPSVHLTAEGGIGIDVGGHVIVMDVYGWHKLAMKAWQAGTAELVSDGESVDGESNG